MIGDNPAARLLAILERGNEIDKNRICRDVWRELLQVDNGDNTLLISRLGKLMELPVQAVDIIQKELPNQSSTYHYWTSQIHKAFSDQNLNAHWSTFKQHIDSHTLTYLRLTADLIQSKSLATTLKDETINDLKLQADKLLSEVINSDLSQEIKKQIARYLQKIIILIDEYRISGAIPIAETVESAFGHTFFDEEYREAMSKTEIGSKFVSVLSAVASAVTIALGAPELPQAIQLMIENIKK